jgi:Outer membrane lipoprotein carrier protein LolA-like
MISGIDILLSVLLLSQSPTAPPAAVPSPNAATPAAAASDAATLIASLARPAPSSTSYVEVRFVHMLRKPLVLRGELTYGGADKLGKRVVQPYRETTTIAGGSVDVQRDGRSPRQFSLDRAPELQALLAGFSALLGGDAATLEKSFKTALVNHAANWTLTLAPRDAALARHLREIVVDGSGSEPNCFSLHEADGDASVMLLGALTAATLDDTPTLATLDALCHRAVP